MIVIKSDSDGRLADCTTLLATIQWNDARDKDFDRELRDFRAGCCTFLKQNMSGWRGHMSSRLDAEENPVKPRRHGTIHSSMPSWGAGLAGLALAWMHLPKRPSRQN